jgi:phosphatidylethanolamine/phosphatidyl-N-methylethanolamine N-methyltransferase
MANGDVVDFFCHWARNPSGVGAVAPSGTALAKLITAEISSRTGPVIELGPGTGVFTRALLDAGIFPERLALIEYGSDFVRILQQRFPHVRVVWMDAARLGQMELFGRGEAGAVISGLPLLTMPPRKVMAILEGVFTHLRPSGAFYQFTYAPRCPIPKRILDRLDLRAVHRGTALANLPPANVYRIVRKRPRDALRV